MGFRYVNKRMVVLLNKLSTDYAGGIITSDNNIREGQSLGFVEQIYHNSVFGEIVYPDIFHQAGAYMFYIIKNHIFSDGNKRTGLSAAITFLKWNDIMFIAFDEDKVFDFVIDVAKGENKPDLVIPKIAKWLRSMSIY